jgi:hypothetical protein
MLGKLTILGGVMLAATAIILPIGWTVSHSPVGIRAGAEAAGVCLLAAAAALIVTMKLTRPGQLLLSLTVGMSLRMGIPLAAAMLVHFSGGPLADAGFVYYIVAFYGVALTSEIIVSLPARDSGP